MKFFRRSQIAWRVLCVLCVLCGVAVLIGLLTTDFADWALNPEMHLAEFFGIGGFLVLVVITVLFGCIVKDAQEDGEMLVRYSDQTKTDN